MQDQNLAQRDRRWMHSHGLARHARHFARRAVWEAWHREAVPAVQESDLARRLAVASQTEPEALLASLGSGWAGLSAQQVAERAVTWGPNVVGHEDEVPAWRHLWHCYSSPFNVLLSVLAVVSLYTGDMTAMALIWVMVSLSTLLRFVQERRSSQAAQALKALVSSRVTVCRAESPQPRDIPMEALVPGDLVVLSAGDMVPADLRVLRSKDLFLSQSAMTGEAAPVEKFSEVCAPTSAPFELHNVLFMGTNVASGSGVAVVLETGARTFFGALAQRVTATEAAPTAFQTGINQVSWLLIRFTLVMVPLVLLINGWTKGNWLEALLFALSVAVGLTPEMLPMIVTSTLAKGAVFLSRQRVIVKRLDAIQNFGAMDVLCVDKTGTLTQDRICLERHIDVHGQPSDEVLRLAYLNSHHQTGLKNLLDVAVLAHAELHQELGVALNFRKVDEVPFDFQRRRMSVVVASLPEDQHWLICKGAVEEVLSVCTRVREGDADVPLTPERMAAIHATTDALHALGLRVVSVAWRVEPAARTVYGVSDEVDLTLVGYVAFLDPPKDTARAALTALQGLGISVKVLTGDNDRVTAKVCQDVGLTVSGLLLGAQVEALDDGALAQAVSRCNVFAKLSPAQKERIVAQLRQAGHVVGFMGDGINDAPALRAADIGISVDSAVDIAQEAADIILLEKSLMVLKDGVVEGRRTFANMLKYIKMTASSNFGNVLSVLIASAFLPFLPMLPLQLLVQNLLYDLSQTAIPFDRVDAEALALPQRWNPHELGRFMLWFGPASSVFDLLTFALLWFAFEANSPAREGFFHSGWFVEGLLSQTLIVHLIRTRRVPFLQSRAATPLLVMSGLVMAAGVFLVMGPLGPMLKLEPLPGSFMAALFGVLIAYAGLVQGLKVVYARRHGWA